jgi:lysozyme
MAVVWGDYSWLPFLTFKNYLMDISQKGIDLIKQFESLELHSYQDETGIWTIGWGTIRYPDGTRVKEGDTCTAEQAQEWLNFDVSRFAKGVDNKVWGKPLNQSQFDALCSFVYNLGMGALSETDSTLRKLAKVNPDDPEIYQYNSDDPINSCAFTMWVKAGGKVSQGLVARRKAEADLYASEIKK